MNKPFYKKSWFFIVALVFIIAAAFGGEDPIDPPKETASQEVSAPAAAPPAPVETAGETKGEAMPLDESLYASEMGEIHSTLGQDLTGIGGLFTNPKFGDSSWTTNVAVLLNSVKTQCYKIKDVNVPEKHRETHERYVVGGVDLLIEAMEIIPQAVDNQDSDKFELASFYMGEFTRQMEIYSASFFAVYP